MALNIYHCILAGVLVFTGSMNTLSTKWADLMKTNLTIGNVTEEKKFDHPFLQANFMFIGEFLCLLAFKCFYFYYWRKHDGSVDENVLVKGNRNFNPFLLLPPAMCDMVATSIMYIGLNLTYPSSFQMLRGAVIVFTGTFSMLFLHRRLGLREWLGIALVILGLGLVGLSDFLIKSPNKGDYPTNRVIIGDVLIIGAQVIAATQMVLEEKFVSGQDIPPLQAVGWEGFFGFTILGCLLVPFYFIKVPPSFSGNSRSVLEDALEAFALMRENNMIIVAMLGTVISIAFFNYAGISVTKEISATTRMMLDSVRTLIIWIFSLLFRWQSFHWLQIIGFILLIAGMSLYNNIVNMDTARRLRCCNRSTQDDDEREILQE